MKSLTRAGLLAGLFFFCTAEDCPNEPGPAAQSGLVQQRVEVRPGADGLSTEQRNVARRLKEDNLPGSIKHLYVISAFSGQVILYSTVQGKVTSGGKRLGPLTVTNTEGAFPIPVEINGVRRHTNEVIQDDGTYGSSADYLYWWDTAGIYHQHYVSGGQIVHISSEPIPVKSVIINMSNAK